jgi:hypothetical protein
MIRMMMAARAQTLRMHAMRGGVAYKRLVCNLKPNMVTFVTVLFACFLASHARAVAPAAAAGLAELQAALGEGGLEDAQEVGLALRRLGLATALEVGLLDAAERLELTVHLKAAEISLGDRARLRRMTALTGRAHAAGDPTESPEMWEQDSGRAWTRPSMADGQAQMRRAQQDGRDESATNTQLNNQAEEHASTAQPGTRQASGSGISSDSASSFASNNLSCVVA